tara:strand:- start:1915 stop:2343 length:429 start_codon:yes stop_codon:yes gene_type:complete
MSESEGELLQTFTIDQAAGALALSLGAVGSLLLVVWQSRCLCKCRIGCSDQCYLFDCAREPPPDVTEENASGAKKKKITVDTNKLRRSPRLAAQQAQQQAEQQVEQQPVEDFQEKSPIAEPEPEPEPQVQSPEPISSSWKKL